MVSGNIDHPVRRERCDPAGGGQVEWIRYSSGTRKKKKLVRKPRRNPPEDDQVAEQVLIVLFDPVRPAVDAVLPDFGAREDRRTEDRREVVAEQSPRGDALRVAERVCVSALESPPPRNSQAEKSWRLTKQTRGRAIKTPHRAPPRIERYMDPGTENA